MSDEWLQRAEYHLSGWAEYRQHATGTGVRGYPTHSSIVTYGGCSEEFDALVAKADFVAARICDRVIDDLSPIFKTTLESAYIHQGIIKHNRRAARDLLIDAQFAFWERARKWLV